MILTILLSVFVSLNRPSGISDFQPKPSPEQTAGKVLMEAKCVKCHELKKITDYNLPKWEKTLPKMIRKAKLQPEDQTKIMTYIRFVLATKE